MIDVYLFHAVFALQILLISVLIPRRLLQLVSQAMARRSEPLPTGGDEWVRRHATAYRWANAAIVAIGLLLLASLFSYMRQPEWTDGPVEALQALYVLLQFLPLLVIGVRGAFLNKALWSSLQPERKKAVLQRRGLFDFVSPAAVTLALLCYLLYVVLIVYIQRDPFPGFAGAYVNIGIVTLCYGVIAFAIYRVIYGTQTNPLQSHAERMYQMGTIVKALVYSGLASVLSIMINMSLILIDRQHLEPFAHSACVVVLALVIYRGMRAPLPKQAGHTPSGMMRS